MWDMVLSPSAILQAQATRPIAHKFSQILRPLIHISRIKPLHICVLNLNYSQNGRVSGPLISD